MTAHDALEEALRASEVRLGLDAGDMKYYDRWADEILASLEVAGFRIVPDEVPA